MKKLLFYGLTLLLLSPVLLQAQMNPYSWQQMLSNPNLHKTLPQQYEQYMHATYTDSDTMPRAYKHYARYMQYWHNRLGVDAQGNLSYQPYFDAIMANRAQPVCNGNNPAHWELLDVPMTEAQNQGLFTEILPDPDYPEHYLTSSNHGGMWKFNPDNKRWYNVTDDLRMPGVSATDFLRSPFDHNTIFASTGSGQWRTKYGVGLLQSFDRGETWEINQAFVSHVGTPYARLVRLVSNPNDNNANDGLAFYAAGTKDIYYTPDNGQTWQTISPGLNLPNGEHIIDMEITDDNRILIGTAHEWKPIGAHMYVWQNNIWDTIHLSDLGAQRYRISTPDNHTIVALKDCDGGQRRIYKSMDNGYNWMPLPKQEFGSTSLCMEIEYSYTSNLIFTGNTQSNLEIFNGTTGKRLATKDKSHVDIRDIYIAKEGGTEVIYHANDGGLTKYIYQRNGNVVNEYYNLNGDFLPCNNAVGLGVANSMNRNVIMQCTHQGVFNLYNEYMSIEDPIGDADDIVFHPANEYICYNASGGSVGRVDMIDHVNSQSIWGGGYLSGGAYIGMKLVLNPNNPDILYFPSKKHHLGIYNDATKEVAHKATISTENDTLWQVGAIGVAADNDIYIAEWRGLARGVATKLMVSHNVGNTWQDLSFSAVWEQQNNQWQESGTLSSLTDWRPIHSIVCNPENENELWISIGRIGDDNRLRVLHSTDGGSNWYDYSRGLSKFPITKILYDYPTETLFAGTDVGVFYRQPFANNNDTAWQCFSTGLPMGGASDMEINNCTRTLYMSINGRSVFHSPIPFPEINSGNGLTPEPGYIVNTDEVWNSPRVFTDNVIVMPHVSLTINAPCYFAENTGIKVKPTGILHVNALLTNQACGTMWNGIETGGHTLLPPTLQYQAVVYINEGGRIQHAKTGVCNYLRDDNGVPVPLSYGGIIKANKADFINNYISCDIQRYKEREYISSKEALCDINQSKFWIDLGCYVLFDGEKQPPICINVFDNTKIIVRNNHFTSSIINLTFLSQHRLPTAIRATNSAIQCTNNKVYRCEYGVYSLDYEPRVATDLIQNNRFSHCINGIYQHGTSGSCIVDNTLSQCIYLPSVYNYQTSKSIRMYLDKCNNYIVEDNTFRGNFPTHKAPQIGLIVNDGGPNDQIINNNDLQGFDYAILAQGNNRNATGSTGLSFKCNNFLVNRFDISVSAFSSTPNAGIAALQGSNDNDPTAPAGNRFNHFRYYEGHFHNLPGQQGNIVTYYHHQTNEEKWKRKLIPGYIDPDANLVIGVNVEENTGQEWDDVNIHCPAIYSKGWAEKQSLLAGQKQIAQNSQTQLRLWTDQGDTPAMAQEIDNSSSDEAFALRNQLLNTSPYLSQEVLQKATAKEQVLNNALLRDVLVANPQAAKDQGVLQALGNRVQPMPTPMEQQILAGQTRVGAKEALEATRHQAQGLYNNTLTAMQATMQNDSSNTFTADSLLQLLSHAHNIDSRYRLAALYQAQDNNAALQTVWQNMTADFQLSANQQQEAVDMQSYLGFLKQLRSEAGSLPDSLETVDKQTLQNWHENSGNRVGALAQNVLIATHAVDYTPPLILPDLENYSPQQAYTVGDKIAETPPEVRFEVYPNPAKDYIIADYKIEKPYNHANLQIVEVGTARLCQSIDLHTANNAKTIALQGLSVGTYTIYLQIDGEKRMSYTFEVIE